MSEQVIAFQNVSFSYEGEKEKALEGVSLSVEKGDIIFLTGSSGCGKSTLLNLINGIIPEIMEGTLQGDVLIDGKKDLKIFQRNKTLGSVFQNPRSQFFTTNTTSELVFGMENYGRSKEEMKERLKFLVNEYQIENLLNREIYEISSGERQLLALLSVLMNDPQVVIFDEPSANLDYGNAMRLRKQILDLKQAGKTVLVADHRCFYLKGMIDKVFLIQDKTVEIFLKEEDFFACDYGKRVFDLFSEHYEKRNIAVSKITDISLENVSYQKILEDVSLEFHRNEVTAIVGVNGAGKTTLARLLTRMISPDKGKVVGEGQALYIMQDADFQLFGANCLKELEITEKDTKKNMEALEMLNLEQKKNHHPQNLSGGEKQRLQMAISYVSNNRVIIFDEPTSGLDQTSMYRVKEMMEKLKKDRTLILISHDYEFIRKVVDRVVYIKDHRIKEQFYLEESQIEKLNQIYKEMEDYYE